MNQQLIIADTSSWDEQAQRCVVAALYHGQTRFFHISHSSLQTLCDGNIDETNMTKSLSALHFDIEQYIESLDIEEELATQTVIEC